MKKRKRAALSDDEAQSLEESDVETDEYQPSETQPSSIDSCAGEVEGESEGEGRKRKHRKKSRTAKRTHFHQDFGFIPAGKNTTNTVSGPSDSLLPSSVRRAFLQSVAWLTLCRNRISLNASTISLQNTILIRVNSPMLRG